MKQRQLVLKKKVDAYFEWAKLKYTQVTQKGTIGTALGNSINQKKYLRKFLSDGNIPMDNNPAEQAIRPFTIGRKNFVLIESDHGAKTSAMIYSLIETAKANSLNTYKYLEMQLTVIPNHMNDTNLDFIEALLPWSSVVQQEPFFFSADSNGKPDESSSVFSMYRNGIDNEPNGKVVIRTLRRLLRDFSQLTVNIVHAIRQFRIMAVSAVIIR